MLLLSQVLVSLQYRVGPLGFLCLPDDQIGGNVGLMDQVERENWERSVKLTTGTTTYINILKISCWLCNGCTITSQTLEATLTEWPFRWITLDIVVLWLQLCYFHQLLYEMVTQYILIYEKRQKIFYLIFRVNQLEVLQSPTTSSHHCLNVIYLSRKRCHTLVHFTLFFILNVSAFNFRFTWLKISQPLLFS